MRSQSTRDGGGDGGGPKRGQQAATGRCHKTEDDEFLPQLGAASICQNFDPVA